MALENKRRILIVEDEKEMQDVMQILLERMGYEIISAYDVATAVQILRAKPLPIYTSPRRFVGTETPVAWYFVQLTNRGRGHHITLLNHGNAHRLYRWLREVGWVGVPSTLSLSRSRQEGTRRCAEGQGLRAGLTALGRDRI